MTDNTLPQSLLTTEEFTQAVTKCGLMASEAVQSVQRNSSADDARDLAAALVSQGKLTHYQAIVLLEGRKEPLVLDRYIILEKLDAGGMGQVFKALHRPMERVVALKMPLVASVDSPEKVKRFQREVRAAAKLSHPNIVTSHDACESGGVHFLVMELVDGKDLHKLVKTNGPLPLSKAVKYIVQAARGMEHAHASDIVHRDIKPSNLLLDKEGTVKVLDLGLARFESRNVKERTSQQFTETGVPMGTVDFMSPEQALDAKHADHRSDIYSLGCTLYFLLTGRPPYREDTPMKTFVAHREQAVPSIRTTRADVPEEVDVIFHKMVAKRPEDRFQSMGEVIEALDACEISDEASLIVAETRKLPLSETECPKTQTHKPHGARTEPTRSRFGRRPLGLAIGLGLLFVGLVVAGIILKIKTSGGTIVLECNQPELDGAVVTVDGEEKITIKMDDKTEPITIKVDKGRRKLEVVKGGFKTFTDEFEIGGGERKPITVRLERLPEEGMPAEKVAEATAPADMGVRAVAPNSGTTPPLAVAPFSSDEARKHQEQWAAHLKVPLEETNSAEMKLILIPPGRFEMGSSPEHIAWAVENGKKHGADQVYSFALSLETPQHHVDITSPFYLGVYEVTQVDYERVVGKNPCRFRGDVRRPVENVSWFDAVAFCNRLSEREQKKPYYIIAGETASIGGGNGYRLPTEAEWEYSCRAGSITKWNFGDDESMLGEYAWYKNNATDKTQRVGEKKPNSWGLHDMHGNVSEWCWDWRQKYNTEPVSGSAQPSEQVRKGRVLRGGAFIFLPHETRSAFRFGPTPDYRNPVVGFRLARNCG
ncbi:MAG: protein kinase domain-containing protein [Pirellulaceae bacterium]